MMTIANKNEESFEDYWKSYMRVDELQAELGSDELKRIAIDAVISKNLDNF